MTTLSTFWSRIRPWVWASTNDLNPRSVGQQMAILGPNIHSRVNDIEDRVEAMEANAPIDWTKIDAYYVQVASQSFMEHMNRVQVALQTRTDEIETFLGERMVEHRQEIAESIEGLNRRLADAETLAGAEIAKLQAECQQNSERVAMLLRRLKSLGDE